MSRLLMLVRVRVASGNGGLMDMLMVSVIVKMGMFVQKQLVEMLMFVLFVKQQQRGNGHEW